jgi:hypothetical protein
VRKMLYARGGYKEVLMVVARLRVPTSTTRLSHKNISDLKGVGL